MVAAAPRTGGTEVAVYEADGQVKCYVLYGYGEGRDMARALNVSEVVAGSLRAQEGLVLFMAAFDPLMFEVRYSTPHGELLHPFLPSSYVEARLSPEFMLRIVDVEGALKRPRRESGSPLVLAVSDEVIPENAGEYGVGGDGVVRGVEAAERVSLDVRRLAQLYGGYLPARQLVRNGLVRPNSANALELLEAFFPFGDSWLFPEDLF